MRKKNKVEILGETVKPGETKEILVPLPELYDGSPLFMHVHVINGKKAGPIVCLAGAIHGDELNGIEIIRRVLKSKKLLAMSGCVIAIPVVNVYGMLYQQRYLMDRRDLNRSFPGSKKGSLTGRLAALFSEEIISKCTHGIDFHTGSLGRSNLPQIRAKLNNTELRELSVVFNAPVILNSKIRPGTLRQVAAKRKIPLLVYESGEALRLDETGIQIGVRGVWNVMAKLGMISYQEKHMHTSPLICQTSVWVRAKRSGLFTPKMVLGNHVEQGEILGEIASPMGLDSEPVITPITGIIVGINNTPLVHEGAALFNIASIDLLSKKQIHLLELLDNDEVDKLLETKR